VRSKKDIPNIFSAPLAIVGNFKANHTCARSHPIYT